MYTELLFGGYVNQARVDIHRTKLCHCGPRGDYFNLNEISSTVPSKPSCTSTVIHIIYIHMYIIHIHLYYIQNHKSIISILYIYTHIIHYNHIHMYIYIYICSIDTILKTILTPPMLSTPCSIPFNLIPATRTVDAGHCDHQPPGQQDVFDADGGHSSGRYQLKLQRGKTLLDLFSGSS